MNRRGFHSDTPVHDPSCFVDKDGKYYLFGSHMTAAESTDLRYWTMFAEGVSPKNPLFSNLFDREVGAFDYVGKFDGGEEYEVWAPNVSYNAYLRKYVMYFCTSGSFMKSCLCMATADEVKGPYKFERILLYSGFSAETVGQTNVQQETGSLDMERYLDDNGEYNYMLWPNCIDPNTFHDAEGRFWMVYGSWSGGIFLIEIDEQTGLLKHNMKADYNSDPYFGKRLLGGNHHSMEGASIYYDKDTTYYYLFVSFGQLTREGGYQIRMFRSQNVDGPYVDMKGRTAQFVEHHEEYGVKLIGNYLFPGMLRAYKSPGHNSVLLTPDDKKYIVYHQRFEMLYEIHEPRVHQIFQTPDDWLTVCPFATLDEQLKDKVYTEREMHGVYYLIDHGRGITHEVNQAQMVELTEDGRILLLPSGVGLSSVAMGVGDSKPGLDLVGMYEMTEHAGIQFSFGRNGYSGVIIEMEDESGNPTLSISGVGGNHSIWAVRYF